METKQILTYAIEIGSDISNSFLLLANIYQYENNVSELTHLISIAEEIQSPTKASLVEKLNNIRNQIYHNEE